MTKKNDNDEQGVTITEQPTGEYPAPVFDEEGSVVKASPELNGTAHPPTELKDESVKAAFWLSHLETEVSRLHAKWQSIDAEFKSREARLAELHKEIEAREATIVELTADLLRQVAAVNAANELITSKDGEIAALTEDRRARDERIAALSTELADAEVARKVTLERIERAEAEASSLNDSVRREQAATATMAARNEQLLTEQQVLQLKIQDLEIYINGRHDRWSELNSKIADYKDALIGMEKTVKARDAAIARHDEEKRHLAARILDLERQSAELAGRRKEREEAYDELQKKLSAHFEQTEQLKAEYATRAKETEQAIRKVVDGQRHSESLERGIKRRDESIGTLTSELEQSKSSVTELTLAKEKFLKRGDELEKGLTERSQQVQVLREDLRVSRDQLHLTQQQLSDRATQLASSQEALDQKSRHVDRLANDLHAAQKDATHARDTVEQLEGHADELAKSRDQAVSELDLLKVELAAQEELIASLETELRAKQATADLLERNVDRITDLGASMAALDREMSADGTADAEKTAFHLVDFVATLAADKVATAAADAVGEEEPELLSMDLLLDGENDADIIDVGEQTNIAKAAPKLVLSIAGENVDYPLVSGVMTIGRGHDNDIHVPSHYVSRVHAKIRTSGLATIIEDAGSKNGILVNSERVKRRVLHHGDVVSLGGDLNLRFIDAMH